MNRSTDNQAKPKAAFKRLFLDSTMLGVCLIMAVGFTGLFAYDLPGDVKRWVHLGIAAANAFVIYRCWKYLESFGRDDHR